MFLINRLLGSQNIYLVKKNLPHDSVGTAAVGPCIQTERLIYFTS
jgi:hypothetical protein